MPFPIPSFLKGRSNEKDEQAVAEPSDASARESQPTESTPARRLIVRVPVAVDEAGQSEPAKLRKLQIRPVPGYRMEIRFNGPKDDQALLAEPIPEGGRRFRFNARTGQLDEVVSASES
jgi:hypothetical protein